MFISEPNKACRWPYRVKLAECQLYTRLGHGFPPTTKKPRDGATWLSQASSDWTGYAI